MNTPNTPAHSPLPWNTWNANNSRILKNWRISAANGEQVCTIKDSREIGDTEHANAAHIVLCVNSHDKLREALGMAQYCLRSENGYIVSRGDIARTLKAIAAALREGGAK